MAIERNFTGHEMGDAAELRFGNGGTISNTTVVDDSTARSGTYYLRQTPSGASTNLAYFPAGSIVGTVGTVSSGDHKRVSVRSYFRIESTLNTGQCRIFGFGDDVGTCTVWYGAQNTSGGFQQAGDKIGLRIGTQSHNAIGGAYPWGTVDLSLDVWYRLQLDIDLDVGATTDLTATLRITEDSDSPSVDFTLTNSLNIGATDNLDKLAYGYSTAGGAFARQIAIHWDDTVYIATSDSDASSQPTLPDATSIFAIVPPTGFASNDWSGSFTDVDEYPIDSGGSTMSSSGAAGIEVEFTHPTGIALSVGSVTAMKLYVNALVSGGGSGAVDFVLNGTPKSVTLGATYPGITGASDPIGGILWSTLTPRQFTATTFGVIKQNAGQATAIGNIGLEILATEAQYGTGNQIRGETQIKPGSIFDAQIADGASIQRHKIQGLVGGVFPVFLHDDPHQDDWLVPGPPGSSGTVRLPVVQVFFGDDSGGGDDGAVIPGPAGAAGAAGTAGVSYNGEVLLAELTASSSGSLDFATRNVAGQSGAIFQSDYDAYIIKFQNVLPATDNVGFWMRMSTDGGSSYDSGNNYRYANYLVNDTGSFSSNATASSSDSHLVMASETVDNSSTTGGVNGSIEFINPLNATQHKNIGGWTTALYNDTNWYTAVVGGAYKSTTAVNAVRFLMSSGNIASGTIRIYGLTKTPQSLQNAPAHGLVLLAEQTGSGVSSLDFVSRNVGSLTGAVFQSDYDEYWFEIQNVIPATDGVTLTARVSTDGGSSYDSGTNYRYGFTFSGSQNTGGTAGSNSASSILFAGTASNSSSAGGQNGTFRIFNPLSSTLQKLCLYNSTFFANDSNYYHIHGSGVYNQTTAVNAIRFLQSSGNLTGTIRCYGVIKSVTYPVSTIETGTHASRPSVGNAGRIYLPNDGFTLGRDSGTAWETFGPVRPFTPPSDSGFAWVNQNAATIATTKDALQLYSSSLGNVADIILRVKTAPTAPYSITAYLDPAILAKDGHGYGLAWRQSSDGKIVTFWIVGRSTEKSFDLVVSKWTNATSFSADYQTLPSSLAWKWMRITDDNSNRVCSISVDGQNWIQIHSVGRTDFLTADQVGFMIRPTNSATPNIGAGVNVLSWKQT